MGSFGGGTKQIQRGFITMVTTITCYATLSPVVSSMAKTKVRHLGDIKDPTSQHDVGISLYSTSQVVGYTDSIVGSYNVRFEINEEY